MSHKLSSLSWPWSYFTVTEKQSQEIGNHLFHSPNQLSIWLLAKTRGGGIVNGDGCVPHRGLQGANPSTVPCGDGALCRLTNRELYPLSSSSWVALEEARPQEQFAWDVESGRSKVSKGHRPLPQPKYIATNLLAHLVGKGPQPPLQSSCSTRSHISCSPIPKPGVCAATQQKALAFSAPFYVIKTGGSKGCAGSSFPFFLLPTRCCFSIISPTNLQTLQAHQRQRQQMSP